MTVFQYLLRGEKYLPPKGQRGDFSSPVMGEIFLGPTCGPLLVTNTRGDFVLSRPGSTGVARYGFSPCPVDSEDVLFGRFFCRLGQHTGTRCKGLALAQARFEARGVSAQTLVVSVPDAVRMLGPSAPTEGVVGQVQGLRVVVAGIPDGQALLAGPVHHGGHYTRVGDHLGLLFRNVDQNLVLIDDVVG